MYCPHNTAEVCSWCQAAFDLHNSIVVPDDPDLWGDFSNEWVESVQAAALKYRTLVGKGSGIGIDDNGRIVPPEGRTRLYPS